MQYISFLLTLLVAGALAIPTELEAESRQWPFRLPTNNYGYPVIPLGGFGSVPMPAPRPAPAPAPRPAPAPAPRPAPAPAPAPRPAPTTTTTTTTTSRPTTTSTTTTTEPTTTAAPEVTSAVPQDSSTEKDQSQVTQSGDLQFSWYPFNKFLEQSAEEFRKFFDGARKLTGQNESEFPQLKRVTPFFDRMSSAFAQARDKFAELP